MLHGQNAGPQELQRDSSFTSPQASQLIGVPKGSDHSIGEMWLDMLQTAEMERGSLNRDMDPGLGRCLSLAAGSLFRWTKQL
ncbi:hypothetical protein EYF80_012622 [Liparis tanakae]|uniref:Uncharacterized protein n=1 Tax=Liparis tanakae TaxID=230148 RepID=A0A4Z2IIZ6_9TELE|nr:hypothetical protein EYF80_012622 [Liparis tanakae]